ncbi:MAG: glycosyltransferase family 4 protein [Kofleriaceae bacterium]
MLFSTNRYRTYDRRLYETLASAFDLSVIWINPPPSDEPVPREWKGWIRWWTVGDEPEMITSRDIRRSAKLFQLAVREGRECDLFVASTTGSWKSRVFYAAARVAGVPVAVRTDTWRDNPSGGKRKARSVVHQLVTDYMERHASGVLVSGIKTTEYLVNRGVPRERISPFPYLHPDLAEQPLDPGLVARLRELKQDRVAFLYLGRIMEQKGLVPLIRTFRSILATGRDAVLFVVGAPITEETGRGKVSVGYFEHAKQLASGEPRIVFFGQQAPPTIHNFYEVADVFVHPHVAKVDGYDVHEAWGNVITEAACMRMPIVGTDRIPSCFDIIDDGVNGYLLPAEAVESRLFDALVPFVDRPELIGQFGSAARRKFEQFADPALTIETLQRVMSRSSP